MNALLPPATVSRSPVSGFTLLELLVVIALLSTLLVVVRSGRGGGGQAAALQSAQATLVNLLTAARATAMARGQSVRILVQIDATSANEPSRFLHYVALQTQTAGGWQTSSEAYLPEGVYVVPGNFATIPAGLFAPNLAILWNKTDGSALRSTALRSNQISSEAVNSSATEQWVSITLAAEAGTVQSGDIILAAGRRRPPGTFQAGESPVELINPENVRGLTLSSYGVPALINNRSSF